MIHLSKKAFLFVLVIFTLAAKAGTILPVTGDPRASISYNAEKSGKSEVEYNTSFFIFNLTMDEADRNAAVKEILATDNSFRKLELMQVNGVKDMMVIVDVSAKNLKELTKKMKAVFGKLKVKEVDYNGAIVTTETFSF
jgi:hypothetical protein